MCFKRFLGPQTQCKHVYSDNSAEILGAMEKLGILNDTATPYRPETNGVIQRANRRIKEGTSCVLVQAGLVEDWFPEAIPYFCFARCIKDILVGGKTAWELRFNCKFPGPDIPMGCEVHYLPIKDSDKARTHKYGSKLLPGLFFGYSQHAGGGWDGDLLVVDQEQLASDVRA